MFTMLPELYAFNSFLRGEIFVFRKPSRFAVPFRNRKGKRQKKKQKQQLRIQRVLEPRVQVVTAAVRARTARRDPEIVGQIVAAAHTTRRELEPVREYAATVVGRIIREQSMQPVLLFAPAALSAEHLLVFEPGRQQK